MKYFFNNILNPYIKQRKYKCFCEIGAREGKNTDNILQLYPEKFVVIDPCVDCDLKDRYNSNYNVVVHKGTSLKILPQISESFDCIFIDGDHNWYTVYNELKIISKKNLLKPGGTIFLHDVSWPYGRRDMYYLPETIPEEFRHAYEKKGMIRGESELVNSGGKNSTLFNAKIEGGSKNGVLTAIEDFLKEFGHDYMFFSCKEEWGIGFLVRRNNYLTNLYSIKWMVICHYRNILCIVKDAVKKKNYY